MRQKLLSWGDDFTIRDESGGDRFFVDGKAFALGNQLSFRDPDGNELAFIRQKLLAWGPTYELYGGDGLKAVVKKDVFTLFHCSFRVDVPGPDDLVATGDFTDHEYEFRRHDGPVAVVSKRWFSWTDTYGVDVSPGEDDVLILAAAVVIDLACHERRD
jgi:uncharacterized protein YxjI